MAFVPWASSATTGKRIGWASPQSSQRGQGGQVKGVLHEFGGGIEIARLGICVAWMSTYLHFVRLMNQHVRLTGTPWGTVRTEGCDERRIHMQAIVAVRR